MKDDRKLFIIIELLLAVVTVILAVILFEEQQPQTPKRISLILQDSDASQWAALKYGMEMAAEDQDVSLFVVNTSASLTAADELDAIKDEISRGSAGIIVQPLPGTEVEASLRQYAGKVPLILIESQTAAVADDEQTAANVNLTESLPVVEADNSGLGQTLAQTVLSDYNGNLAGKTIGLVIGSASTAAAEAREAAFRQALQTSGADMIWTVSETDPARLETVLPTKPQADIVVALDSRGLMTAGACAADKNLHGAVLYGIGNSTEAIYYLDTGLVKALIVPDEFEIGYQSLTEIAKSIKRLLYQPQSQLVSFSLLRRDNLFSKENQDLFYALSQ
ncbi:MAG: substrate-binding domain-containing protein [Oscillospiraceae bacterium]|nr:substrate-binding domain-containing protein [Oscillospiraceae bacterium]